MNEAEVARSWIVSVGAKLKTGVDFAQMDIDELLTMTEAQQANLAQIALLMFSAMIDETDDEYLLMWIPLGETADIPRAVPAWETLLDRASFTGSRTGLSVPGYLVARANPSDWHRSRVQFRVVLDHSFSAKRDVICTYVLERDEDEDFAASLEFMVYADEEPLVELTD